MLLTYSGPDNTFQTTKFNYVEKVDTPEYYYQQLYQITISGIITRHLYIDDCPEWLYHKNHFYMHAVLPNNKMFKFYIDYCPAVDEHGQADFIVFEATECTQSQAMLEQI